MKSARPERLLFVLQTVSVGGMETHVMDLVEEIAGRDIDVSVVVPEDRAFDVLTQRILAAGGQVIRLTTDARNGRLAEARRIGRLVRYIRTLKPDVVHIHTGGATGGLLPA